MARYRKARNDKVKQYGTTLDIPNIKLLIMNELIHGNRQKKSYFSNFESLTVNNGLKSGARNPTECGSEYDDLAAGIL